MAKQFEYMTPIEICDNLEKINKNKRFESDKTSMNTYLNELGKDGWEITYSASGTRDYGYFAKREITAERTHIRMQACSLER